MNLITKNTIDLGPITMFKFTFLFHFYNIFFPDHHRKLRQSERSQGSKKWVRLSLISNLVHSIAFDVDTTTNLNDQFNLIRAIALKENYEIVTTRTKVGSHKAF